MTGRQPMDDLMSNVDAIEQALGELSFWRQVMESLKRAGYGEVVEQEARKVAERCLGSLDAEKLCKVEGPQARLSSRAARKLNDREVAKILGGVLGFLVDMSEPETVLRTLRWMLEHWDAFVGMLPGRGPETPQA